MVYYYTDVMFQEDQPFTIRCLFEQFVLTSMPSQGKALKKDLMSNVVRLSVHCSDISKLYNRIDA